MAISKQGERCFAFLLRNLLIKRLLINSPMPGQILKITPVFTKCLNKVYSFQWMSVNGDAIAICKMGVSIPYNKSPGTMCSVLEHPLFVQVMYASCTAVDAHVIAFCCFLGILN